MLIILDTDHLSLFQRKDSLESLRLTLKFTQNSQLKIATSIITFEEQTRGWLAILAKARSLEQQIQAYARLSGFVKNFREIAVLPFDEAAANEFARLKTLKLGVASMDLKIASIALANDALLLSRNLRDFEDIANLKVEDWTIEQGGEN